MRAIHPQPIKTSGVINTILAVAGIFALGSKLGGFDGMVNFVEDKFPDTKKKNPFLHAANSDREIGYFQTVVRDKIKQINQNIEDLTETLVEVDASTYAKLDELTEIYTTFDKSEFDDSEFSVLNEKLDELLKTTKPDF